MRTVAFVGAPVLEQIRDFAVCSHDQRPPSPQDVLFVFAADGCHAPVRLGDLEHPKGNEHQLSERVAKRRERLVPMGSTAPDHTVARGVRGGQQGP